MHVPVRTVCQRFEVAQAHQNLSILREWSRVYPESAVRSLEEAAGIGLFIEPGHWLNQGLALGLGGAVTPGFLGRLEALLADGANPIVVEATSGADPDLFPLLAARGYRIRAFQQVMSRVTGSEDPAGGGADVEVRPATPDQFELWGQVVEAGFRDCDALGEPPAFCRVTGRAEGNTPFLAWVGGEPAGAGTLGLFGGVAVLSATSIRPSFRGRGAQRALVAARIAMAWAAGCGEVCASVEAGSISQANLERCGFKVRYPKLELIKGLE